MKLTDESLFLSAAGAIIVEWNVREPDGVQAGAGMWDTHFRYAFQNNECYWSIDLKTRCFTFVRIGGSKLLISSYS